MYKSISTEELKSLVGKINIIDIRDSYLYNLSSIPTARNIPINYLLMMPDRYLDKEKIYYIYCQYGVQSSKACSELVKQDYKVINILGGYNDYISKY